MNIEQGILLIIIQGVRVMNYNTGTTPCSSNMLLIQKEYSGFGGQKLALNGTQNEADPD